MISFWDGALWKIDVHAGQMLVIQRFLPGSDFPYSRVECPVDAIINNPTLNPCEDDPAFGTDKHKQAGHLSMVVNDMPQLWDLILTIISEGEKIS